MKTLVFTTLYPNNIWPDNNIFIHKRISNVASLHNCSVTTVAPVPYYPPISYGWRRNFLGVKRKEVIEGVEVFHPRYFITPKIGMHLYGLMMFLSVLPTVKQISRNFDFDLIDSHFVYPDGFAAILLAHYFKKPVVVSARGTDINLYKEFLLIRVLLRYTMQKANRLISVCQALKNEMIRLGAPDHKISVIPNGVDQQDFYPVPKDKARRILGLPTDKKVILSVGSLIPRKGFDLLIKALKMLVDQFQGGGVFLVIVGEGSFRPELERLVAALSLGERVYLPGSKPYRELYLWYNAADIFCLASSREGWPNVLMESMACGTPIVATEVWGVPEIIQSDKIGLLTERNVTDIARNIRIALQRPWDSAQISGYIRGHTWNRVARSVFQVFKSVVDSKSLQ